VKLILTYKYLINKNNNYAQTMYTVKYYNYWHYVSKKYISNGNTINWILDWEENSLISLKWNQTVEKYLRIDLRN